MDSLCGLGGAPFSKRDETDPLETFNHWFDGGMAGISQKSKKEGDFCLDSA